MDTGQWQIEGGGGGNWQGAPRSWWWWKLARGTEEMDEVETDQGFPGGGADGG
jgi:hypothetical protein